MVKYIDIELLKKEINRLYQEHSSRDYCDEACSVLDKLDDFIDSLQQEQQDVDLEKEIDAFWNPRFNFGWDEHSALSMNHAGFASIARHFYELGQKDAANKYDEIEYSRQRAEQEMHDKTLDEAAEEYVQKGHLFPEAFLAIPTFKDGAKWQKEQMMKVAVEGIVKYHDYPEYKYVLVPYEEFNDGDKVRIIIVKED